MPMTHNPRTITAANSVIMMRCKGVYDDWFKLEGFQADNAANFGDANIGETRMGVDGKQSGGYTPHEVQWTLYLEANSLSRQRLENIRKFFNSRMETAPVEVLIDLPSIGERHTGKGFLVSQGGGPSVKKLLDGTVYNFNMVFNGGEAM